MRQALAIFLLFTVLIQCSYKLAIITYYEVNKDYIAAQLCENKDKPMTMCYGKCFVTKKIQAEDSHQAPATELKFAIDFDYFLPKSIETPFYLTDLEKIEKTPYVPLFSNSFLFDFFHPPQV